MSQLGDNEFLFTSESVTEGHPDKVADQISDGVLDAVLRDDPYGRVACETLVNTGLVVVSGEISTDTYVDIQDVARETIRKIGYTDADLGFSCDSCAVINAIDKQSPDIAQGVDHALESRTDPADDDELDVAGAGDQGMMFGYATRERDRERHQLGRLPGGVAEHHPLVPGAGDVELVVVGWVDARLERMVDPLRDVGGLLVDRVDDRARVGREAEVGVGVADLADRLAGNLLDVDVGVGRDLAGDQDQPRVDERLAGDAPVGIVAEDGVEHAVGDLVGDLVRVAFGHGLGGEEVLVLGESALFRHCAAGFPLSFDLQEELCVEAVVAAFHGHPERLHPVQVGAEIFDDLGQPQRLGQLHQPLEVEED